MHRTYTQADRPEVLDMAGARTFRKTARIIAVRMTESFTVRTDRGPMEGSAGDWLATNHLTSPEPTADQRSD